MAFLDNFKPIGTGNKMFKGADKTVGSLFFGNPEQNYQQSILTPEQQRLQGQGIAAGGQALQQAQGYYNDLFNPNGQNYNALSAPVMRQFNEEIVPGLAEQFAGMGAGNLSSSGFRNAAVGAGADLSERLGAIRAQLRQQGAQGLQGLYQQGLQPTSENIMRPGTGGLLDSLAPALGTAAGSFLGPLGAAAGGAAAGWLSNSMKGKSDPYQANLSDVNSRVFQNNR
jgi:hypothetical protein